MQLLADVLQRKIEISPVQESCALGAAVNACVAAGVFPDIPSAQQAMSPAPKTVYRPHGISHEERYKRYLGSYGS